MFAPSCSDEGGSFYEKSEVLHPFEGPVYGQTRKIEMMEKEKVDHPAGFEPKTSRLQNLLYYNYCPVLIIIILLCSTN